MKNFYIKQSFSEMISGIINDILKNILKYHYKITFKDNKQKAICIITNKTTSKTPCITMQCM